MQKLLAAALSLALILGSVSTVLTDQTGDLVPGSSNNVYELFE